MSAAISFDIQTPPRSLDALSEAFKADLDSAYRLAANGHRDLAIEAMISAQASLDRFDAALTAKEPA